MKLISLLKVEGGFTKPTNLVHDIDRRRVSPETIMDRNKCDVALLTVKGSKHHVGGIQRVDEIRWKSISLLYNTWLPKTKI